jgi:hypothetical protein
MILDQLQDRRKTSTNKMLVAGIVLAVVLVVFGAIGYFFTTSDSIKVIIEENVYGISGKIVEVRGDSIIIETATMPYGSYKPLLNDKWTWTVLINKDTEIIKLTSNENVSEAANEEEYFTRQFIMINALNSGDIVTVTSNSDIGTQFPFDDKTITANKIEAY